MDVDVFQPPFLLRMLRRCPLPRQLGLMERLFGPHLAAAGIRWTTTAGGLRWRLDLANPTHRWLVYGDYQGPSLRRWAERHLPHGGRMVVSGANIGQMIASLHPHLHFGAILAFEPDHEAHDWLEECLGANADVPARLIKAGLGAEHGRAGWVHSDWSNTHGAQSRIDPSGADTIPIVRLDDTLRTQGWESLDLWILDIEGAEYSALQGAGSFITEQRIAAIFMEVDQSEESRCAVRWLTQHGYASYRLGSRAASMVPAQDAGIHGDLLFVRKSDSNGRF